MTQFGRSDWDKTEIMLGRIGQKEEKEDANGLAKLVNKILPEFYKEYPGLGFLDPRPKYYGRPIIARDTPIDGGVYLGEGQREAIVVDWEKSPTLQKMYDEVHNEVYRMGRPRLGNHLSDNLVDEISMFKTYALRSVYKVVIEHMPRNDVNLLRQILNQYDAWEDGKISLERFLERGAGVCRHKALAAAVLIERLIKDNILSGNISVDRNATYKGGHAWARYTNSGGIAIILDPEQKYFGKLKDAGLNSKWLYARPSDQI